MTMTEQKPTSYTQDYANFYGCALDLEQHRKTCGYWYTVTSGSYAHTAFATARGLARWAEERNLQLEEIPTKETWKPFKVTGKYRQCNHLSYDEFYALPAILETKTLSNGDYTLARITQDEEGIRTVHTLNPNCKARPVFDYAATREEMDGLNVRS